MRCGLAGVAGGKPPPPPPFLHAGHLPLGRDLVNAGRSRFFPLKPLRSPADFGGVTQRNVNGRIGIENGTRRFGSGATAGEVRVSPGGNGASRNGNRRRDTDHGGRSNDIAAARHVNGMTPQHNGARRFGNGRRVLALQGFCNRLCSIRREPDQGSAIGVLELFTIDAFNLN